MSSISTPIFNKDMTRIKEKGAKKTNWDAVKITAQMVRSTLGPRGLDKMIVGVRWTENNLQKITYVTISNDGFTILKDVEFQHPASKMLVETAKTQDYEVGDGTTSVVVFTGELVDKAHKLIEKGIHPNVMEDGYKTAAEKAKEVLNKIAIDVDINDDEVLKRIALTSMGSKMASIAKDHLADIVVKAIRQICEKHDGGIKANIDNISIMKKGGTSLDETELVNGVVIEEEVSDALEACMLNKVKNAKIALLKPALDLDRGATVFIRELQIDSPEQLKQFITSERNILKEMVEKISSAGANVLFCEKALDYVATHHLTKKGIMGVRRVSEKNLEKIAKATGASIVSHLDDVNPESLGEAGLVEEIDLKVGGNNLIFIHDCKNPRAVTIVLRGGAKHVVDEAERALHDALCVVRNVVETGKIVAGGGAPEAEISKQLRTFASTIGGRKQLAVEAFADSLEVIPTALAENAGLDPTNILINLRAKHYEDDSLWYGVNVFSGAVEDMMKLNVLEPYKVKMQMLKSATEASCMIIRIDGVMCAKLKGEEDEGMEARLREMRIRGRTKRRWGQTPVHIRE